MEPTYEKLFQSLIKQLANLTSVFRLTHLMLNLPADDVTKVSQEIILNNIDKLVKDYLENESRILEKALNSRK